MGTPTTPGGGYNLRKRSHDPSVTPSVSASASLANLGSNGTPTPSSTRKSKSSKATNGHSNGHAKADESKAEVDPTTGVLIPKNQKVVNVDADHDYYEFGGPVGCAAMMVGFPILMYYMWSCLVFHEGHLVGPKELSTEGVKVFVNEFWGLVREHAIPTPSNPRGAIIYLSFMTLQLIFAAFLPGYTQVGLPVSTLNGARLVYNCNALASLYSTLALLLGLHFTNTFRLNEFIDHFGTIMTTAMVAGFVNAAFWYVYGRATNQAIRMSGNVIYDYFMGAILNPRVGPIDIKMWAEVRIPWILLFVLSLSGCAKQYDEYGYVSANQAFMVLATWLYVNACAKAEELIPQTWDIAYEKFGWMLSFWNLAGVPFPYANSILYMASHSPTLYRFPTPVYFILYGTLLTAYYVFDTSMSQKSRHKIMEQGIYVERWTFPQFKYGTLKDPKCVETKFGTKLLVDGWWAWCRKPNYTADFIQASTWALCAGFGSPLPYFYPVFFFAVLVHRCGRDFERCSRKYGESWEEFCRIVPYKFIPYVY